MKIQSKYLEYAAIIIAILMIVIFNLFTPYITGAEAPMAVVSGTSMLPLFHEGDIVFLYKPAPQKIHVGDVIVYKRCGGGYIIHRVIDIVVVGKRYYYVTKGDNNPFDDSRLGQFYEYSPVRICSSIRAPGIPHRPAFFILAIFSMYCRQVISGSIFFHSLYMDFKFSKASL